MAALGLAVLSLPPASAAPPPQAPAKGKQAREGVFAIRIAGHYFGTIQGTVSKNLVTIQGEVFSADGERGEFVAVELPLRGNHSSGEGTVMGLPTTIDLRVDRADNGEPGGIKVARLVGTFYVDDGHVGRIVGARLNKQPKPTPPGKK